MHLSRFEAVSESKKCIFKEISLSSATLANSDIAAISFLLRSTDKATNCRKLLAVSMLCTLSNLESSSSSSTIFFTAALGYAFSYNLRTLLSNLSSSEYEAHTKALSVKRTSPVRYTWRDEKQRPKSGYMKKVDDDEIN